MRYMERSKYREVYETLLQEMRSGKYKNRRDFPSDVALTRRFHCSAQPVKRAMEQLQRDGFVVRCQGQGTFTTALARNASGKIGVIVHAPHDVLSGTFVARICDALTRVGRRNDYQVIIGKLTASSPVECARQMQQKAREFSNADVEAVVLQPVHLIPDAQAVSRNIVAVLSSHGIPVVLFDFDIEKPPSRSPLDVVGIDNTNVGYRLGNHLIDVGAKNIHFLMRPNWASTVCKRLRGVASAVWERLGTWSRDNVLEAEPDDVAALKRHIKRCGRRPPDAFVCGNDSAAVQLLEGLKSIGLSVPADIMLAGFDDDCHATSCRPMLTTIRQPYDELGEILFRTTMERIRHPKDPPREITLDAPLVVRESTVRKRKTGGNDDLWERKSHSAETSS